MIIFVALMSEIIIIDDIRKLKEMLREYSYVDSLDKIPWIRNVRFSKIFSLRNVFACMYSLKDISALEFWDVSEIMYFDGLFEDCCRLESLKGLEKWDVRNAITFDNMFLRCESLKDILALTSWNVSNVLSMVSMFEECHQLDSLRGLERWNVGNVRNFRRMFIYSPVKNKQAIFHWDVSQGYILNEMFENDTEKVIKKMKYWKLSKVTDVTLEGHTFDIENELQKIISNMFCERNRKKLTEEEMFEICDKNEI